MKFYKTTKADGSSWHDPDFIYEEGRTYRPKRGTVASSYKLCTDAVLHACSTPERAALAAWGVRWPFLLWSFEGTPVVADDRKIGFRQIGPMVAEDVSLCFGPNGKRVVTFIRMVNAASSEQLEALKEASGRGGHFHPPNRRPHIDQDAARWSLADHATWTLTWHAGRRNDYFVARQAVCNVGPPVHRSGIQFGGPGHVATAAMDAAGALVMEDLAGRRGLTRADIDAVLAPIAKAFGADWYEANR